MQASASTFIKEIKSFVCHYIAIFFSISLILPVYAFGTSVITEFGATQTKNFSVLWCLYSDQVVPCSSKLFGVSINICE